MSVEPTAPIQPLSMRDRSTCHTDKPSLGTNVRPKQHSQFSIPFSNDLVIRAWQPRDRQFCMQVISTVLSEYNLEWDPDHADQDVVQVELAYQHGEFWLVEKITTSQIVGTAAFYSVPKRGKHVVEIRKMYLDATVRRLGLGTFLLSALEQRALQLGYQTAIVETASVLKEACVLYQRRGYLPSKGIETSRCDMVLEKQLATPLQIHDSVEVVDQTRGWSILSMSRKQAIKYRLPYRAVVIQVETQGKILVHKRSLLKLNYAGKMSAVATGYVKWGETIHTAACREISEEFGIADLQFYEPFGPFLSVADSGGGQRILFHPFVATGNFVEEDIVCNPDEVESAMLLTRDQILQKNVGGDLWARFRKYGL